jgi:hypothetical protein
MTPRVHALLERDVVPPLGHPRIVPAATEVLGGPLAARRIVELELVECLAATG